MLVAGLAALLLNGGMVRAAHASDDGDITIGALLSLTGEWSSLGNAGRATLEIAAADVNRHLAQQGIDRRVEVVVRDTMLDPALALAALQELAAEGVRVVIGPQKSAEVAAVKPFADANDLLVISPGSTASALSIAGDNVFRLIADDRREADAIVALMQADGIRTVVPMWRVDLGNEGLQASVRQAVEAQGGSVAAGVPYGRTAQEFETELKAVSSQVRQAVDASGPASVAVYLAGFDETATILAQASEDPVLASVRWYGGDGAALAGSLLTNAAAAAFAGTVGYPCPLPGLDDDIAAKWQPVAERVQAMAGEPANALALAIYDAVWVIALASTRGESAPEGAALRQAIVDVAAGYIGITGSMALNEAGDRQLAHFDFWSACGPDGTLAWRRTGTYHSTESGSGTITRLPGCDSP
jgi:branched-chain amino acid transport system substrate-binding protein